MPKWLGLEVTVEDYTELQNDFAICGTAYHYDNGDGTGSRIDPKRLIRKRGKSLVEYWDQQSEFDSMGKYKAP